MQRQLHDIIVWLHYVVIAMIIPGRSESDLAFLEQCGVSPMHIQLSMSYTSHRDHSHVTISIYYPYRSTCISEWLNFRAS
jgi:hypothetical protein